MPGIYHDIEIKATPDIIYKMITTADGLEKWWTLKSSGQLVVGERIELYFSEEYDWEMEVVDFASPQFVEYKMTRCMEDWKVTRLRFELIEKSSESTLLRFTHSGWEEVDDHFRRSSLSWALYLRILRRYIEEGEFVAYGERTRA
jgi:uncharacterized protein YndB with AHSA1/START domain